MSAMDALFTVQDEDTIVRQLNHRHANLPERMALAEAEQASATTATQIEEHKVEHLDLFRRQRRYEGEVAAVEDRLTELDTLLYGGTITSPKEAVAIQTEIGHLRQRLDSLEGTVLEVMEELEPVERLVSELDARGVLEAAVVEERRQELQAGEEVVDSEINEARARRSAAAGEVAPDVLARYERIAGGLGASSFVHFVGSDCSGCPYSMPAVEADRVRALPEGTLAECTECGRLVAR
jgi:predicted  nucleic acid-binding Zn-ribbon protein|tara:strand:+ start:2815 stop:3528 length:714 start_codon:yes stop_codon:yes gene_type:complete